MFCRMEDCTSDSQVRILYRNEVGDYCLPHACELIQTDPTWVALAKQPYLGVPA